MGVEEHETGGADGHHHPGGHVQPPGEHPEHRRERERLELLREAAIQAEYATGHHEETEEEARRHVLLRLGTIVVGFVVLIGGLVMMALPGPGIVTVIAGLAILSRELPWAERMLEYAKEKARVDELKEQPAWVKGVAWGFTALAIGASLWWMFLADPKPGLADILPWVG
ncbi:MAG: PGPGW domain-containing protein [Acidimicrobiales bacterium]|nr:PGPGW domain-containing protein [Acidimicrobiales bacterium]